MGAPFGGSYGKDWAAHRGIALQISGCFWYVSAHFRSRTAKSMATILIAEDYDDNRELLRIVLNAAGYEVHEARNGTECVQIARRNPPDLVMVDLSMPELDGWGVFKE